MQQAAAAAQARKGGRMSPAEGWETVPSARRESGRSRQGAGARADGQGRRHAGAGSGRSNSGGGATGAGSGGSGRAGSGARRGAGSARGLDPRAGEPDSEAQMFDPETRQRLHNMLDEYIEKKCASNEQCQKSDFDASAREALQRISFLQALQAIEHFASSVSSRIVNRPAYLMGILRGQEMHWDKSRAAASLPGGSADLLGMPGELMLLVGEFCLVGHCMPSDFTPEVCLALQRLTPPLAVKAVQAFNANKRICAGNRGGVLNRPRFFQRLIQNVADQNSEASEDTPGASSASGGLAGDTDALGASASALPPGHPDGQDDKPFSQTQQHTSSPPPLGAPASSLEDEEEDSGGLGQHATTKQETLQPPTHTRNAWGTPETGTTSASTSNPSAGGNSNKLNVSTPSARSADGSASSVSTGTGSGEADDADGDGDADPDADPAHEAYEEHSVATAADIADGFASTGRPSLTASGQVGSLVVPSSGVLDSADGGEDSAAVAAAVAAAAAGGPGASTAAQTGSGSAATQAWDDSAFGAAGNAIYWNPGGLGPVAGEPTTPKSARGRTSSFMTPSPQVHFKDRPQTADRSARHENTAGPSAAFDDPRSRPAGLVGSDFLDSAFDTRSRTSSVAYESQSADATAPPWDAVRDRNSSLFFNTAGPSASSGPVAGSSATGPTGLPRAPGHGPDAGVFFSDPSAFSDQFASTASSGAWTNSTGPSGSVDVASSANAWTQQQQQQQQRDGSPSSSSTTTAREPSSSTSSSNSAPPSESSSDLHARVRHLEGLCARLEQENSHLRQRQDLLTAGLRQLLAAATAPAAPR